MLATSKGHASVVQILVNAKANLNLQNKVSCGAHRCFGSHCKFGCTIALITLAAAVLL
jgi:hypothetical protein